MDILSFFLQNADSFLALPSSAKTILTLSIGVMIILSLISKLTKFIKITAIVAVIYFAMIYFGII